MLKFQTVVLLQCQSLPMSVTLLKLEIISYCIIPKHIHLFWLNTISEFYYLRGCFLKKFGLQKNKPGVKKKKKFPEGINYHSRCDYQFLSREQKQKNNEQSFPLLDNPTESVL